MGQTLKQLMHDMKDAKFVDFVVDHSEIESLKKYKQFEDLWLEFRRFGGNPDSVGVIVATGHQENDKEKGFMQFYLMDKSTIDRLGNILNKKRSEWSSADRAFMIDDKPQDLKAPEKNLIEVKPDEDNLIETANPRVKIDLSYLDPSFKL